MNRRYALWVLGGMVGSMSRGMACLWDTDTLRDELRGGVAMFDLVTGQFGHHGDAYYRKRLGRLGKLKDPSAVELNDMAVARVRLEEFDAAEKLLDRALGMKDMRYETLSNIGVTAKKRGDFARGAEFIGKALKLKAEGHMGLGDWYLKALRWRAEYEVDGAGVPQGNFLGVSYAKAFFSNGYGEGKEPMKKPDHALSRHGMLLRNDQGFADGFLLVGDYLKSQSELHLSFLAHTRAMMLGHQNPDEIRRRRRAYLQYFGKFGGSPFEKHKVRADKPWAHAIALAESIIKGGEAWLESFKAMEAKLLRGVVDERKVTMDVVEKALEKSGVKRARGV